MARLTRFVKDLFASAEQVAAEEERSAAASSRESILIEDAADRMKSTFSGVVRSVVFNPDREQVRLEAELYDGTGALALVWLGRRRIAGIAPGTRMFVTGTVSMVNGRPIMYNPRYELRAKSGAA